MTVVAHPPETLEGWYALHQVLRAPADGPRRADSGNALRAAVAALNARATAGWSAVVELVAGDGDFLVIHFRPSFDDVAVVRSRMLDEESVRSLQQVTSMVSVTEAGLYHISADLARLAVERDGRVGDDEYKAELARRREAELSSEHVQRRLYPPLPTDMPYVCFYPMSKRRESIQNWYTLPLEARSRLMRTHGETGRRYAGRIQQVITGGIGFSEWEWGVTLFAKDPLDFKKLVTDMRFDEVSAKYAEFGDFYVGKFGEATTK